MDVKEAVQTAKRYVVDILADENIRNIATEEVVPLGDNWKVTISFFRNEPGGTLGEALLSTSSWKNRVFKVIEIKGSGAVVSMTHRTFPVSN